MRNLGKKNDGLLDGEIGHTPFSIKNDAFDVDNFEELKSHSEKLLASEEEGRKEYEQYPALQQDMFDALFKYDPELNPTHAIKRDYLLNKKIMGEMLETPRYKELRAMTELDVVNSTIGTELLSDQAMELVKKLKAERKALQEVIDAGNAMDTAQQQFNQSQKGQASNVDPGAGGKSTEELELEEAERRYEEAMENFEEAGERKDFEREIDRMVAKVQNEVRETSEAISNWGLGGSASFQKKSPHEKMEIVRQLRNSDKLKEIARLTGKFRRLAQVARKEKVKQGLDSVYSITQGDDVSRLLPAEIMRMLLPITRKLFLMDLLEKKTLQYEIQGKQKKGKGPVIICIDSSGSMDGLPEIWAKAVALVLLEIAREQKRDFFCIHFSSGWHQQNLHTNEFLKADPFDAEQLLDMAEYFEAGGTEFEPPLDMARTKIGVDKIYEKADIIFVTDGESVVRDEWLREFKKWKTENKVNIYSVLIDSYDNSVATVRKFSDRVDKLSNLRDSNNNDSVALELFLDI
jgi:uncharacterized protein with von Willebrand factor type A (vWA) domain